MVLIYRTIQIIFHFNYTENRRTNNVENIVQKKSTKQNILYFFRLNSIHIKKGTTEFRVKAVILSENYGIVIYT